MGYVKMYGFHGNNLYDSREWAVDLEIQSYQGFYISSSTKIGVKLKLDTCFFSYGQICKSSNLHIMNINENLQK